MPPFVGQSGSDAVSCVDDECWRRRSRCVHCSRSYLPSALSLIGVCFALNHYREITCQESRGAGLSVSSHLSPFPCASPRNARTVPGTTGHKLSTTLPKTISAEAVISHRYQKSCHKTRQENLERTVPPSCRSSHRELGEH